MAAVLKATEIKGTSSMSQSVILGDGAHNRTPNAKAFWIRSRFKDKKDAPYQHECYTFEPGGFYAVSEELLAWLKSDSDSPFARHKEALEVFELTPPKADPVKVYVPGAAKGSTVEDGYPVPEWDAEKLRMCAAQLKGFPLNDGFRMATIEAKADMLRKFMKGHGIQPSALNIEG